MRDGRGRRRGRRWISEIPEKRWFAPEAASPEEVNSVLLLFEELEAIRLVDLLELKQEEAAFYMGVSRKAFWNDLRSARKKIATALVYGMGMKIDGGSYLLREKATDQAEVNQRVAGQDEIELMEREILMIEKRLDSLKSQLKSARR